MAGDCYKLENENLCMKVEWTEGPHLGQFSSNIIRFVDLDLSTEDEEIYREPTYSPKFFGWMIMGHHEHGTRPVTTTNLAPGIYKNEKIFFMGGMQGEWQFKAKLGELDYVVFRMKI